MKDRTEIDFNNYETNNQKLQLDFFMRCPEDCIDCGDYFDCQFAGDYLPTLEGDYSGSKICDYCLECKIQNICTMEQDDNGNYVKKNKGDL